MTHFGVYDQEDNNQKINRTIWRVLYFRPECTLIRADPQGFYSIRVNNQWRIIFRWSESGATHVSLVNYH
ncbi:MAG: hypothetical protein HN521_07920 [Candidatus Latescibacteria bacterium]|nr:hypothetical protein [Candidatus Latescibacterota bacterium]MBT5832485.1 hypothetical protein [Candidatus Latescibacterota bacterium]